MKEVKMQGDTNITSFEASKLNRRLSKHNKARIFVTTSSLLDNIVRPLKMICSLSLWTTCV